MRANNKSQHGDVITMQSLEDRILDYIYYLNMKYYVDSISLARLCYKMQRSVIAVKSDLDSLVAKGLLDEYNQGDVVSYTISKEGIDYVKRKSLMRIGNLMVAG